MNGRDIGEEILAKNAILGTAVLAAGTGDATEINGSTINRAALGSLFSSCKLAVHGNTTLASGATLTITANMQDSADGATWADYGTAFATTTVKDAAGGALTAVVFEAFLDNDLRGARQYIRAQVTPNLSAGATDTAMVQATLILGGPEEYPAD